MLAFTNSGRRVSKLALALLAGLCFAHSSQAQDTDVPGNFFLTGTNGWLFHHPNDGRTTLYIAPAPGKNANWTNSLVITNTGSVGIGTASQAPNAKLQIVGAGGQNIDLSTTGRIKTSSNDGGLWIGDNRYMGGVNATSSDFGFWHSGAYRLSIKNDGRIVIANGADITNAATGYLLSVKGKVMAEEVKVSLASAWPDYVFEPSYTLRPLSEVAQFVKLNKHLPGVPSAREVAEGQGISLGEMNAKLLEKVEELTLYLVEQQQQMELLKQQMATLQGNR